MLEHLALSRMFILDVPDDILRVIVVQIDNPLIWMRISKRVRQLAVHHGAHLSLTQTRYMHRIGTVPVEHMKSVLRGATRLLRDHKLVIDSIHHAWSFCLHICPRHGDCGKNPGLGENQDCNHLTGNLLDLLDLKTLVEACPSFTLHREDRFKVHSAEAHFTVVVRPFYAEYLEVQLEVTSNPKKFVVEPWVPRDRRPYIMGNFFEVEASW